MTHPARGSSAVDRWDGSLAARAPETLWLGACDTAKARGCLGHVCPQLTRRPYASPRVGSTTKGR